MTINSANPAAPAGSELKTNGANRATANSADRKPCVQKVSTDPARVPGPCVIPDDTRRALEKCELFRDFTRLAVDVGCRACGRAVSGAGRGSLG